MIYKCKYFVVQEFVPRETYEKYGPDSWRFIAVPMLKIADGLRELLKRPVTINNWHVGGEFNYSGYRPPECKEGAPESSHKRSMAIDVKVDGISADMVQKIIKDRFDPYFEILGLTGMELNTPTWTHLTCENFQKNELVMIPFFSKEPK